ncbi:MAG: MoaD/ThiS family protein [Bacteroidetes bacterium]|nr:MoaD/ThiS family protein [Bacteroidota bacterium]
MTNTSAPFKILLFGITKEIVGSSTIQLELSEPTVGALKAKLRSLYPDLGTLNYLAVAVNENYATDQQQLRLGDEIALIPPVSGG